MSCTAKFNRALRAFFLIAAFLSLNCTIITRCQAAGVTIITHGLNGNADGWITGMAEKIPLYNGFPGTNYSFYKIYFLYNGSYYYPTWARLGGSPPPNTDSGEIVVAFDWSQLADGSSYNTYQIAYSLEQVLTSTNFIPEMNGHALCELPIHLIGHSRGGSLMCETSRLLGTNGIWVDHLTTLDPHPLNNDGFNLDIFAGYTAVDAPCATYTSVLFHDNCWEDIDLFVRGEAVAGAYVRQLSSLSGGYQNTGDTYYPHSNAHLWYHGSIDWNTPTTDTEASITATERSNWWIPYEDFGGIAGFYYSLIGGGDRTSTDEPLGSGNPAIADGYNQNWDLGAGVLNPNRTSLSSNNGSWPDIIKFDVIGTNIVEAGGLINTTFYYQYAGTSNVSVQIFYDKDHNPYGSNSVPVISGFVQSTGASSVYYYANLALTTTNVPPGTYAIYGKITDGVRSRYLYAPQEIEITAAQPNLDVTRLQGSRYAIGVDGLSGEKIILQTSIDLQNWAPLATNLLMSNRWIYTNTFPASNPRNFVRAVLQ